MDEPPWDCIIVGAGVAGLAAAQLLYKQNIRCLVLEGNNYIGGRCYQMDGILDNRPIDIGAEFVHGTDNEIVSLVKTLNLPLRHLFTWSQGDGGPSTSEAPDGGVGYYYYGNQQKLLRFDVNDEDLKHTHDTMWSITSCDAAKTPSLRDYLSSHHVSTHGMALLNAGLGNTLGGTLDSISSKLCAVFEEAWEKDILNGDHDFRVDTSFRPIIQAMARNIDIRLSTPVAKIIGPCAATGGLCRVITRDGNVFYTKSVIVTVSLAILRENSIQFEPPFSPRRQRAFDSIVFANGAKIFARFSRRCWPEDCHGAVCADSFIPELWMTSNGAPDAPQVGALVDHSFFGPVSRVYTALDFVAQESNELCKHSCGEDVQCINSITHSTSWSSSSTQQKNPSNNDVLLGRTISMASSTSAEPNTPANEDESVVGDDPELVEYNVTPQYLVTGFMMAENADKLLHMSQEEAVKQLVSQLDQMFGMDAAVHFECGWVHVWSENEFVRGAYTSPSLSEYNCAKELACEMHGPDAVAKGNEVRAAIAAPHEGSIFFGGEATSGGIPTLDSPCTLHGALRTGLRAASQALTVCRPRTSPEYPVKHNESVDAAVHNGI